VCVIARRHGVDPTIDDQQRAAGADLDIQWRGPRLRDYQQDAVDALLGGPPLLAGRGILKMPTRAGKTVTASAIIHELKSRALFVVSNSTLLEQAVQALREFLGGMHVGQCGDGEWAPGDVTVATAQTLSTRRRTRPDEVLELLRGVDVVIADEVHHMQGGAWSKIVGESEARHRFGLSATVWLRQGADESADEGSIYLRGLVGPVRYSIPPNVLIDAGYLVRPRIQLLTVPGARVRGKKWSDRVYKAGIVHHEGRNGMIRDIATREAAAGRRVLVIVSALDHALGLRESIPGSYVLHGESDTVERRRTFDRFRRGELRIIIGTIVGEGLDLPENDCVIVAEGGRSRVRVLQRLRCITPAAGKTDALCYDFADDHNPALHEHARERREHYSQPGYLVEWSDVPASSPTPLLDAKSTAASRTDSTVGRRLSDESPAEIRRQVDGSGSAGSPADGSPRSPSPDAEKLAIAVVEAGGRLSWREASERFGWLVRQGRAAAAELAEIGVRRESESGIEAKHGQILRIPAGDPLFKPGSFLARACARNPRILLDLSRASHSSRIRDPEGKVGRGDARGEGPHGDDLSSLKKRQARQDLLAGEPQATVDIDESRPVEVIRDDEPRPRFGRPAKTASVPHDHATMLPPTSFTLEVRAGERRCDAVMRLLRGDGWTRGDGARLFAHLGAELARAYWSRRGVDAPASGPEFVRRFGVGGARCALWGAQPEDWVDFLARKASIVIGAGVPAPVRWVDSRQWWASFVREQPAGALRGGIDPREETSEGAVWE
jgi:superfamily II DNA or RNA helicase